MTDETITLGRIRTAILAQGFRHANEAELHNGIAGILTGLGLTVRREVRLDEHSRIDLTTHLPRPDLAALLVGIEVKVDGGAVAVRRQVRRYAAMHAQLGGLMLITTMSRHLREIMAFVQQADPADDAGARWLLDGMPFEVVHLQGRLG